MSGELTVTIRWESEGYVVEYSEPPNPDDRVRLIQLANKLLEDYGRTKNRRPWGEELCGHCGTRPKGYAVIWRPGAVRPIRVCHAETSMNCYRLMTVFDHQLSCEICAGLVPTEGGSRGRSKGVQPGEPAGAQGAGSPR